MMNRSTESTILLITPPLTQVNTPYPASAVLKGFLVEKGYRVFQADLGLEVILGLFTRRHLETIFDQIISGSRPVQEPFRRILSLHSDYLNTIADVIRFLQGKDPTLAYRIAYDGFLPEGPRFDAIEDMDWAFGSLGFQDRAKFMATQYIEDLADLIRHYYADDFGFSRYGEKLAVAARKFGPLEEAIRAEDNLIDGLMLKRVEDYLELYQPNVVGFTVPFPGCLIGALKCGRLIKRKYPDILVVLGGGYVNTELRSLKNPNIFDYTDYITLDDGEIPILQIIRLFEGKIDQSKLVRTYHRNGADVVYRDNSRAGRIRFVETGTPDYSDLKLDGYLSVTEVANPMHRLWSDGRWNKFALTHGCYWNKCAFCDVTLDYISRYDSLSAVEIVNRIERIKEQTGQSGFHFIDEAAPPKLLKEMAIEILNRDLTISWWTNIRFEKRFSRDLCKLLAASGCIAISGGLETASNRLLKKMKKGVTIAQAARAANNLQEAGIMVHAYLMYGFPSQTVQETVDSLEIVRQLFQNGLIQSAFWHRFALTRHSLVAVNPEEYGISIIGPETGDFAENELQYRDQTGINHERFSQGLQKAIYNFMYGVGLNYELESWFDFKIPATSHRPTLISSHIDINTETDAENSRLLWIGRTPEIYPPAIAASSSSGEKYRLELQSLTDRISVNAPPAVAPWLKRHLPLLSPKYPPTRLRDWQADFEAETSYDFIDFRNSPAWGTLHEAGLLLL